MAEQNIEKLAPRRKTYTTQKAQNCIFSFQKSCCKREAKSNSRRLRSGNEWNCQRSTKEV